MVSLRSGSCIGADQSVEQGAAEVQSCAPKSRRRAKAPQCPQTEPAKDTSAKPSRNLLKQSRVEAKLDFLQSPAVHTRSGRPIPEISLSTELPELRSNSTNAPPALPTRPSESHPAGVEPEPEETGRSPIPELHTGAPEKQQEAAEEEVRDVSGSSDEGTAESAEDSSEEEEEEEEESSSPDSSESEGEGNDHLAGLAATMWNALQRQRQGSTSTSDESAMTQGKGQISGNGTLHQFHHRLSTAEGDAGVEDVSWRPQSTKAQILRSDELVEKPHMSADDVAATKQLVAPPRDKKAEAKLKAQSKSGEWHELPTTVITDEVKRDLRLLRLRGAMDPKRFYKRAEKGKFATKFALGTVIEGPADFHSSRLTNRERKQTITEELLADREMQASRKRRFAALQEGKSKWSRKKHKGAGERGKKRSKPPKH